MSGPASGCWFEPPAWRLSNLAVRPTSTVPGIRSACSMPPARSTHSVTSAPTNRYYFLERELARGAIECWLHGSRFELATSWVLSPPATQPVAPSPCGQTVATSASTSRPYRRRRPARREGLMNSVPLVRARVPDAGDNDERAGSALPDTAGLAGAQIPAGRQPACIRGDTCPPEAGQAAARRVAGRLVGDRTAVDQPAMTRHAPAARERADRNGQT